MGNVIAIIFGVTAIIIVELVCNCIENVMESKYNPKIEIKGHVDIKEDEESED